MSSKQTPLDERRRAVRRVLASHQIRAIVRTRTGLSEYAVANLGPGGALLVGPPLRVHALVEVVLRAPGGEPVRVLGRVAHARGSEAGVGFLHRDDDAEDRIQAMLLEALERQRAQERPPASTHAE